MRGPAIFSSMAAFFLSASAALGQGEERFQFGVRRDVEDRISGRTGTTDDYTGIGGHLGMGLRF